MFCIFLDLLIIIFCIVNIVISFSGKNWVNIVLDKAYELYPQYYKNDKLRIWMDKEYEGYDQGKQIYDYPMGKAYKTKTQEAIEARKKAAK